MKRHFAILTVLPLCVCVCAQSPDSVPTANPPPRATPVPTQSGSPKASPFGKEIPIIHPGSEIVTWDGKHWNVLQNRFFQSRFEKYLNAPEETAEADRQYQKLIHEILQKLSTSSITKASLDEAYRLLPQASNYGVDARLCDNLADAIYTTWLAKREQDRLVSANKSLEDQRKVHEWNLRMGHEGGALAKPAAKDSPAGQSAAALAAAKTTPPQKRLTEVEGQIALNRAKRELSEVQAKVEFQALIAQFFLQRRFQHVLMATRFYRHINSDGDTTLRVGRDKIGVLGKMVDLPTTMGALDAICNEAIRDVREGVDAFKYHLENGELDSATKRLQESFAIGEYMPEIRTLPRDQKRRVLQFTQKANLLISALDAKDFAVAETALTELTGLAKDFDGSAALAAIKTAKIASAMHLAKAKNAAMKADHDTLKHELEQAVLVWPQNPALTEVSGLIFTQGNEQAKALADFDALFAQRNYRQIFDDKVRYIAATVTDPGRQAQLKKVLEDMQTVEAALMRGREIEKRGDFAGAWEGIERVYQQFPDDSKINQIRANLAASAANFVHTIKTAQELEEKRQLGSSLAWYLKAQKIYPPSEFAREGIDRLVKIILPSV